MRELAYAYRVIERLENVADLVVYGGALRDTFVGNPVKDIDIAFYSEYIPDDEHLLDAIDETGLFLNKTPDIQKLEGEQYDAGEDSDFEVFFQMVPKIDGMPPVEFIGLSVDNFGPKAVADRCDWGFCQSAFNTKEVYQSVNYKRDMFYREATYCVKNPGKAAIKHSMDRRKRLSKKFKDWDFWVPEHLAKKHKIRGVKRFDINDEKGQQHAYT